MLALKIDDGAAGIFWHTDLTLEQCLELVSTRMLASEESASEVYWTAAVYDEAMCLCLFRYFPRRMRAKKR